MDTNLILLLKQARLARGMKQEEIASVIGVKKNTISNYENGISEDVYKRQFQSSLCVGNGNVIIGNGFLAFN